MHIKHGGAAALAAWSAIAPLAAAADDSANVVATCGAAGTGLSSEPDSAAIEYCVTNYRSVYFPPGYYYVPTTIDIPDNTQLLGTDGASVLSHTPIDASVTSAPQSIFRLSSVSDVSIQSLSLDGKGLAAATDTGHGVWMASSRRVSITNSRFTGFGAGSNSAAAAVNLFTSNSDVQVVGNYFYALPPPPPPAVEAAGGVLGDIDVGASNRNIIVANNLIDTKNKYGIGVNGYQGTNGAPPGSVVVTGNIVRSRGVHCILGSYLGVGGNLETVISNNVLEGCTWNGIYITGSGGGTTVVSSNVIRAAGGATNSGLSAGIFVAHRGHTSVVDNNISMTGYNLDGSARAYGVPAIVLNTAHNIAVRGNQINKSPGSGIWMGNGDTIENIDITDNTLTEVAGGIGLGGAVFKNINILHNRIEQQAYPASDAIRAWTLDQSNVNIRIQGNKLVGGGGTTSSGVFFAHGMTGSVRDNDVSGFGYGLQLRGVTGARVGRQVTVADNRLTSNNVGILIDSNVTTQYTLLGLNHYDGNVTDTQASGAPILIMRQSYPNVEVSGASIPSQGTWKVGDKIYFTAPASGGYIGAVCVTAGTPGTWKNFG